MFVKMVGPALLRGLPGLGEVKNNLSSWLVWQMSFFITFPWHKVCLKWVFGLFSAFRVSGFLAARRISHSNRRRGSPQCWGVIENLPRFFWLILGLILKVFFLGLFGFCFSIPARLGGHEAKRTKWPHSAILCQRRRSRDSGPVLPQLKEAENPLGDSGS